MHVSNANSPAADHLVVGGYDVSGEVRSDGEPMKEVTFLLYSATVNKEVSQRYFTFLGTVRSQSICRALIYQALFDESQYIIL